MGDTAKIGIGGKDVELPVLKGTVGPDVVDIRKLYAETDTFTYDPGDVDLGEVQPFTGELLFGPEIFEPIVDDWQNTIRSVSLAEGDPDYVEQSPDNTLIDELIAAEDDRVTAAMTGTIFDRIAAAATSAELLNLLDTEATALMNDAPLRESIERAAFALRLAEENREGGA